MTNTLIDKTFEGLQRQIQRDLTALDRRIGRYPARLMPGGSDVVSSFRGTTAERDALYGIPATTADQVELANMSINWFNTDFGWVESYYTNTGTAGLTARGLWLGVTPGWYPVGTGPFCAASPSAAKSVTSLMYMGGWSGNVNRHGGATWFNPTDTVIQVMRAGVYDLGFFTVLQNGTGSANFHLRVLNQPGTAIDRTVDGGAVTLNSSLATQINMRLDAFPMTVGQQIAPYVYSGSLQVHYLPSERGRVYAKYISPPLEWD